MSKWDETVSPNDVPLMRINWEDICFIENWNDDEDDISCVQMSNVGWVLEETEYLLIIAASYSWTERKWAHYWAISKTPPEKEPIGRQTKKHE